MIIYALGAGRHVSTSALSDLRDVYKLKFSRQLKYYYIRFIRLRGEPQELALGLSLGVLIAMMPIMPFQTVTAVALSAIFKGSKIMAALGTWVSNPLNWYIFYYYNYKQGAFLLGLPESNSVLSSIMAAVHAGEEPLAIVEKILGASGAIIAAFLLGGLIMGTVFAFPTYFISLQIFKRVKFWRRLRDKLEHWRKRAR